MGGQSAEFIPPRVKSEIPRPACPASATHSYPRRNEFRAPSGVPEFRSAFCIASPAGRA